jgi:predicted metal-dependent peptidase
MLDVDANAWNICCDAEINDDIITEAKAKLPVGVVLPKTIGQADGLLAEEYYESLPKLLVSIAKIGKGKPGSKPGEGNCGSCVGGPKQEHELDGPAVTGDGKSDVPGISELEGDLIRHQIAHDIQQSKDRGDVPDHLVRWAKAILEPKIDWRKVLRAQVRHALAEIAGQVDYTWRKLSRRQGAFPRVLIPAMFAPVPRVAVVVDTSGSMGEDTLASALGEVNGILKACGQKDSMRVISCDAAVHTSRKVFRASQVELHGGGGTDMRAGIREALKERPHLIVVITDGFTPWPAEQPNAKLIVCLVGEGAANVDSVPVWARAVKVGQKEK